MGLLPPFLEHLPTDHQYRVLAGVEGVVTGCFPLTSREYPKGSTQASENKHAITLRREM